MKHKEGITMLWCLLSVLIGYTGLALVIWLLRASVRWLGRVVRGCLVVIFLAMALGLAGIMLMAAV
jgi:hypothetical protein